MSERYTIETNKNNSKNTRLPVAGDFANYRFNRDEMAHVSRYLFVVEKLIHWAKEYSRPLKVLDIGCGDLYVIRTLGSTFVIKNDAIVSRYAGFDIDYKCLEKAKTTLTESLSMVELIAGDVTNNGLAQFQNKEFDIVICLETVEHIKPEYVPGLLSEINRIADYAIISTPNFDGGTGKIPEDHIKEWGYTELLNEVNTAGLKVEQEIGIFCNLGTVKKIAKDDKTVGTIYNYLADKMDGNFLSITMAKFIPKKAQNILRVCRCSGGK